MWPLTTENLAVNDETTVRYPKLGALLYERMVALKMTQADLGKKLGLQAGTVSRYLSGKRLPEGMPLAGLMEVLGLTRAELQAAIEAGPHSGLLEPAAPLVVREDPYPNRAAVLALHARTITPEDAAYLRSLSFSGGDKSEDEWEALLIAGRRRRLKLAEVFGADGSAYEDPPTAACRVATGWHHGPPLDVRQRHRRGVALTVSRRRAVAPSARRRSVPASTPVLSHLRHLRTRRRRLKANRCKHLSASCVLPLDNLTGR